MVNDFPEEVKGGKIKAAEGLFDINQGSTLLIEQGEKRSELFTAQLHKVYTRQKEEDQMCSQLSYYFVQGLPKPTEEEDWRILKSVVP